jgi:hypothetical protein
MLATFQVLDRYTHCTEQISGLFLMAALSRQLVDVVVRAGCSLL